MGSPFAGFLAVGLAFLAAGFGAGCATVPEDPEEHREYVTRNDPFEPTNRVIFAFNERLDRWVFRPLSLAYLQVPKYGRDRLHNVIVNVRAPVILGNSILQGDLRAIGDTLGRFFINSSIGLGGMYDVATAIGIGRPDNDFGRTLAHYNVGEGPYLVLPVFGPSTTRALVGRGADTFLDPLTYVYNGQEMEPEASLIQGAITGIDLRARLFGAIEDMRRNSIDHYAATRSYYRQERRRRVHGEGGDDEGIEGYDILGPTVQTPPDPGMDDPAIASRRGEGAPRHSSLTPREAPARGMMILEDVRRLDGGDRAAADSSMTRRVDYSLSPSEDVVFGGRDG